MDRENSHLSYHPHTISSDGIPGGGAVSGDSEREEAEGAKRAVQPAAGGGAGTSEGKWANTLLCSQRVLTRPGVGSGTEDVNTSSSPPPS